MFLYLSMVESPEDKNKFEEIYNTYRQRMFYLANRIIRDEYLAEDIVHQSFLRIIDNLDKINEINCHKTRGFIVIIVENIAIDFYRKRKRENNISFDQVELYLEDVKSADDFVPNEVEEAILKLPLNYLSIFKLRFSHGYSYEEIAKVLEISEATARQRVSRGKKKLAEILSEEGGLSYE
nr:RNA polymerase sigma factor [Tissierella sp.]